MARIRRRPVSGLQSPARALLKLELARARNEVFHPGGLIIPSVAYRHAYHAARHASPARHRAHAAHAWLSLLGHRFHLERGLIYGGLGAAQIRARVRLDLADESVAHPDAVFSLYMTTVLRDEWDYAGTHFRFEHRYG